MSSDIWCDQWVGKAEDKRQFPLGDNNINYAISFLLKTWSG